MNNIILASRSSNCTTQPISKEEKSLNFKNKQNQVDFEESQSHELYGMKQILTESAMDALFVFLCAAHLSEADLH